MRLLAGVMVVVVEVDTEDVHGRHRGLLARRQTPLEASGIRLYGRSFLVCLVLYLSVWQPYGWLLEVLMIDHKSFRLECSCHEPLHFIKFDWDRWPDGDEDINAFFVSNRTYGFGKRLKASLAYLIGRSDLVMGDIVVSKEKARELAEWLKEVSYE